MLVGLSTFARKVCGFCGLLITTWLPRAMHLHLYVHYQSGDISSSPVAPSQLSTKTNPSKWIFATSVLLRRRMARTCNEGIYSRYSLRQVSSVASPQLSLKLADILVFPRKWLWSVSQGWFHWLLAHHILQFDFTRSQETRVCLRLFKHASKLPLVDLEHGIVIGYCDVTQTFRWLDTESEFW